MNQEAQANPNSTSMGYRSYVLFALLVIYIFNAIDRTLLAILQERIKVDLSLTDFQLGLLGGPAFVVLYTVSQIPIARIAETRNRISIIAIGAAAWSVATAACGFVNNFIQLMFARIAVGIGEASCIPPSHSVISDYFPKSQRATALAIFALGIPLGTMIAAIAGGFVAENLDWRWAFIILGMPGVIAAIVLKLTVKEPQREKSPEDTESPSLVFTFKFLFKKKVFFHTVMGGVLFSTFTFSLMQFLVSFFIRNHGLEIGQASAYFGLIAGVASMIGMFLGGFLTDRISKKSPALSEIMPVIAAMITVVMYFFGFNEASITLAVILLFIGSTTHYYYFAPMMALAQNLAEPRMRATASAILVTTLTLVGYGFGPPLTGALTDYLNGQQLETIGLTLQYCSENPALAECVSASGQSLQTALTYTLLLLIWAVVHFAIAAKHTRAQRLSNQ
jgi:MFS family permease